MHAQPRLLIKVVLKKLCAHDKHHHLHTQPQGYVTTYKYINTMQRLAPEDHPFPFGKLFCDNKTVL